MKFNSNKVNSIIQDDTIENLVNFYRNSPKKID